jgi:ketosteroid isomerase-like protein
VQASPEEIVEAYYRSHVLGDIAASLAYLHDDVRIAQHFNDPALPFSGETLGKPAAETRLRMILADWHFIEVTPTYTAVGSDEVRSLCPFVVMHRRTGETFEGTFRHVWKFCDGRIIALDEFIDVARLKSFLRLLGLPAEAASE